MSEQSSEAKPIKDLRELYEGDYVRFVEEATGKSAQEIRDMSFDERQKLLTVIGVNIPDQKKPSTSGNGPLGLRG